MNNDVVSTYLEYKINNIEKYTDILLKYSLKKQININKTIHQIVTFYVHNYYLVPSKEQLPDIFRLSNNEEIKLKDILLSAINCYQNNNIDYNSKVVASKILFIVRNISLAIDINKYISMPSEDINIMAIINRIVASPLFSENKKLEISNELENIIKKDINIEKKFWKTLEQSVFELNLSIYDNNNIYIEGNYQIKGLNRYNSCDIDVVAHSKDINEILFNIYIEQLQILILKLLHNNKKYNVFFPINIEYLNKKKNITTLKSTISNIAIRNIIFFCISFNDYSEIDTIKELEDDGFNFALYNMPELPFYNSTAIGNIKTVIAPRTFLRTNQVFLKEWHKNNVKFINPTHETKITIDELLGEFDE